MPANESVHLPFINYLRMLRNFCAGGTLNSWHNLKGIEQMSSLAKHVSVVSALALMAIGSAGMANAQTYGDRSDFCAENPDKCGPRMSKPEGDDQDRSKRRVKRDDDQVEIEVDEPRATKQARSDWKFDSNRHERRRHKDDRFRFFFGGFYYPEPYWLGYGYRVPYRIACAEGREIVRDRGFRRVRTLECRGRTYTYLGRRYGDAFRILVSARTGRIIDVDRV